ncbi:MAG: hypothetical protein IJL31_03435, partial [Oscillospiraceae bacterium]|nr:hypothetical protein [Oscillospiraceae bacterium]
PRAPRFVKNFFLLFSKFFCRFLDPTTSCGKHPFSLLFVGIRTFHLDNDLGAPKLLLLLYFAAAAASLIYAIWAAGVLSDYTDEVSTIIATAIGSVIMAVVMIIINHIYYKKRAHLFVN